MLAKDRKKEREKVAFRAIFFVFFARSSAIFVGRVIAHTSRHKRSTTRVPTRVHDSVSRTAIRFEPSARVTVFRRKKIKSASPRVDADYTTTVRYRDRSLRYRSLRRYHRNALNRSNKVQTRIRRSPVSLTVSHRQVFSPSPRLASLMVVVAPRARAAATRRSWITRESEGASAARGSDAGGGGSRSPDPRQRASPKPSSMGERRARTSDDDARRVWKTRDVDASSSSSENALQRDASLCFFALFLREASSGTSDSIATGPPLPRDVSSFERTNDGVFVSFDDDAFAKNASPKTFARV